MYDQLYNILKQQIFRNWGQISGCQKLRMGRWKREEEDTEEGNEREEEKR